jgi:hypothetical protein
MLANLGKNRLLAGYRAKPNHIADCASSPVNKLDRRTAFAGAHFHEQGANPDRRKLVRGRALVGQQGGF